MPTRIPGSVAELKLNAMQGQAHQIDIPTGQNAQTLRAATTVTPAKPGATARRAVPVAASTKAAT